MKLLTRASRAGFTLIELLVAISILLILTAMLTMGMRSAIDKAKAKKTVALVEQIKTALNSYHAEYKDYPPDGYDAEPGWAVNAAQGVNVGTPARRVKGSSALIYFLCRPSIKVTFLGDPNDTRNQRRTRVGPFLEAEPDSFSNDGFDPNHPWDNDAYWVTDNMLQTMLIDAYARPFCYDKVKETSSSTYYQSDRFHRQSAGAGMGIQVHPDQDYMAERVVQEINDDVEPDHITGFNETQLINYHVDPRFINRADMEALFTGDTSSFGSTGTKLEAKNVPGFDLWSYGPSWGNPLDDITSWNN
ncbi:type II secretion system GspH family protein [Planctomycetota bacterium]|nr:type II secretion system GspH family protein [Planctomycetota bacterium]